MVGGTNTTPAFAGIVVNSGAVDIGNVTGNTVGSSGSAGAITVASNSGSPMEVYGINFFPNLAVNISNNTIAGISAANSGAGSLVVYGIRAQAGAVVHTLANNIVGTATGPIGNSSTSASSRILGIASQTGAAAVSGNTIGHLSLTAGNTASGISAGVIGLFVSTTSTLGNNVSRNTIHHLANSHATAAVWVDLED